jgi:type II secretion system protein N
MISVKTISLYCLYAFFTALVFLYLLFPGETVESFVNSRLKAVDAALAMDAASMRPTLPPGVKLSGVALKRDGAPLVYFENARFSPELPSLLKEEIQIRFNARLADGVIAGKTVVGNIGPPSLLRTEADLTRIRIEQLDLTKAMDRFALSGLLEGHITHDGGRGQSGTTNSKLNATELKISLKTPLFGMTDLIMDRVNAEFSSSRGSLRLKALTFEGPLADGKISGTIALRQPFGKSRLNLSGNVKPRPELFARLQETIFQGTIDRKTLGTRGLAFRIRGTVDSPDINTR